MKKVFQTKLKSITKVLTLVIIASLATFTGCKSYDEDINSLNTDVTTLKSQLANLQTYTKAEIDAKIATLTAEVNALKTSAATKAELSALESKVVTIAALNAYKTQVTTDIAAAVAGLATKASVDAVNVEVVKVQTALSALGVSVDAKILALKTELNAKDAELATAIGAVTARVATLEGLVAANTTGVADNKAAIVALQAELTALKNGTYTKAEIDAKLAALDADLKKLGTDLKLDFEVLATRQLSGLLFVPAWVNDGFNAVEVGYIVDIPTAPALSVKALFTQQNVTFRFNPTTADLTGTTWKFINNQATFNAPGLSAAPGDASTLFAAPALTNNNDGSGSFSLKVGTWSEPAAGKTHYFALQSNKVVGAATSSVVSDYVKVTTTPYNAFISDAKKSVVSTDTYVHYRTAVPAIGAANDFELISDNSIVTDLDDLVLASANKGGVLEKTFAAYGFGVVGTDYKYEFSLPTYVGLDGITNQNSFVTLNATTNVLTVNQGSSVIDRNPLVKVDLKSMNGNLLATAYIKFKIVAKIVQPTTVTYNVAAVNLTYPSLFKGQAAIADNKTDIILTWADINNYIYNPLGMTHNDFQAKFGGVTPTVAVTVNGTAVAGATLAQYPLVKSMLAPDVDTYAMKYQVTPLAKFGTTVVTYTFDTGVATDSKVKISFTYTVAKPTLDKTILAGYRLNGSATDILTQGMNAGSNYLMQLYLGEAFSFGTSAYRDVFGAATANKIDGATHNFAFKATTPAQTGAQLTPATATTINGALGTSAAPTTGQLMDLTVKLTTAERVYDMQFITTYPNAETDVFDFKVHFVNPFSIELDPAADFQLIDKVNGTADTQDLMANYIVKFKGKKIVTKGVAETTNSATTVVATDFVDITNAAYGLFYELTPGTSYFTISKAGGNAFNKQSVLTWDNVGTALQTEQTVATTKVKFVASFAEITRTADNVTVKPE
ncbi:MAG: hypothetical protein VB126_06995 [Paludibacter sp.]|nr:hypothetical protein [Paludibacter sp.]